MPLSPFPPFRVFMVGPDGGQVEMMLVRGLDHDGQRWHHAFGPPGMAVGLDWRGVVMDRLGYQRWPGRDRVHFEVVRDAAAGLLRFRPVYQMQQTCN